MLKNSTKDSFLELDYEVQSSRKSKHIGLCKVSTAVLTVVSANFFTHTRILKSPEALVSSDLAMKYNVVGN